MTTELIRSLVESEALRVAPATEAFWYTSGKVGPYYINTHFLFGGPDAAARLLQFIDEEADGEVAVFTSQLQERVEDMYARDARYRAVIDSLVTAIQSLEQPCDCVSGGQRRDWFFSVAVAARLRLPHLYLFKDLRAALAEEGEAARASADLTGWKTVHVADLVTEASSYVRSWIPALRAGGADMVAAFNVVDRAQGGLATLRAQGVHAEALLSVDGSLFEALLEAGLVDGAQHERLQAYYRDPDVAMRQFLVAHPEFLQQALAGEDTRAVERARLLVAEGFYGADADGVINLD